MGGLLKGVGNRVRRSMSGIELWKEIPRYMESHRNERDHGPRNVTSLACLKYTGGWGSRVRMREERFDGKCNPSWRASLLLLYLLRVDYDRGRMWDISEDGGGVWRGESAQDRSAQCRQNVSRLIERAQPKKVRSSSVVKTPA